MLRRSGRGCEEDANGDYAEAAVWAGVLRMLGIGWSTVRGHENAKTVTFRDQATPALRLSHVLVMLALNWPCVKDILTCKLLISWEE